MPYLHNLKYYKPVRRQLRNSATKAEVYLWHYLRKSQFIGFKFRRQYSIGRYVVDFYCFAFHLAIEIDGAQHFEPEHQERDHQRTEYLKQQGITVIRFTNSDVLGNIEGVLEELRRVCEELTTPLVMPRWRSATRRPSSKEGR